MGSQQLVSALDLMRRMPPSRVEQSLTDMLDLCPDLTEDLLSTVDQPLQVSKDSAGKDYLLCDYNRDGDSYRSPWTNTYDPPIDDGALPSDRLRVMETMANDVFEAYREAYFEGGVSSVYFWDLDDNDFATCVLIKKSVDELKKGLANGNWDSIHVIEAKQKEKKVTYKLTSTIMLLVGANNNVGGGTGDTNISGSLTRQSEQEFPLTDNTAHITNMGTMVEEMELRLRESLAQVYFGKTREVVNGLRSLHGVGLTKQQAAMQAGIGAALKARGGPQE